MKTYETEGAISLRYAVAAPSFEADRKYPLWIFQSGDGNVLNTFEPDLYRPLMEQLTRYFGVVLIMPELRRNLYVDDLKKYCELDFFHRITDSNGLIDAAKQLPFADATQVILIGHSAGGEIVSLTAKGRSDIQGVATYGTGTVSWGESGTPLPPGASDVLRNDCSDPSKYKMRSGRFWQELFFDSVLFATIQDISIPYMAMFGAEDDNVRFSDSEEYVKRLLDRKRHFSFEVLQGLDHGGISQPIVWQRIKMWADRL